MTFDLYWKPNLAKLRDPWCPGIHFPVGSKIMFETILEFSHNTQNECNYFFRFFQSYITILVTQFNMTLYLY